VSGQLSNALKGVQLYLNSFKIDWEAAENPVNWGGISKEQLTSLGKLAGKIGELN